MVGIGFEVIPSAKRLIRSLRDMGYEFAAAVADLIDNSIEAKANTVWVDVAWDGEASFVTIADNGTGMSAQDLREALRFGSEREYEDADLGKFGLGLKTASLSQCLRVTVASRQNPNRADVNAYCWDVDHVDATNRWEILPIKPADLLTSTRQHLKETTGTVVIWEQLDRILGYKRPDGENARKQLITMCRELEEHVSMVFHRFLAGEVRGKRLAIYVNGNKVMPWDPFARSEEATKRLEAVNFRVDGQKGRGDIVVEPYVLPHKSKFSTPDGFERHSGPAKWNRQQGFYIYRADRMIQSGGWCGLRTLDEHLKLSRIAVSFNPKLDEEFKINVPKMRVSLPASVRDEIGKAIGVAVKLARDAYSQGERKSPASPHTPTTAPTSSVRSGSAGRITDTADSEPNDGASPQTATDVHVKGALQPTTGRASSSVTRQDLERVGRLLRKVARPEEFHTVENVVTRAISSLSE